MVLAAHPKSPTTPHGRKRQAEHHRQSKHYKKTYWPYLTMLAVLFCGFLANALWTPSRQVLGYTSDLTGPSLLQRTNQARQVEGERLLTYNTRLSEAAQAKANDMVARNYWSHTTPEGNQPWHFIQASGYDYSTVGENLAYGFDGSAATVNAWLNSPEHRANVLNKDFQEVGFGVATAADFHGKGKASVIVALYGAPDTAGASNGTHDVQGVMQPSRNVSRIETISTFNATLIALGAALAGAAAAVFVALKHGRLLRRSLIHGEEFIVKHHLLDLLMLVIGGAGFVLTRSAGIIH
jgi:uncharacterized protein YkwD